MWSNQVSRTTMSSESARSQLFMCISLTTRPEASIETTWTAWSSSEILFCQSPAKTVSFGGSREISTRTSTWTGEIAQMTQQCLNNDYLLHDQLQRYSHPHHESRRMRAVVRSNGSRHKPTLPCRWQPERQDFRLRPRIEHAKHKPKRDHQREVHATYPSGRFLEKLWHLDRFVRWRQNLPLW